MAITIDSLLATSGEPNETNDSDLERVGVSEHGTPATFEEYLKLNDEAVRRLEYDQGRVLPMSTPRPFHADLIRLISIVLMSTLDLKRFGIYASSGAVWRTNKTVFCPDLVVTPLPMKHEPVGDSYAMTEPLIIGEVLSPSTEALDRGRKWDVYQKFSSLQVYFLVDQQSPRVEWYQRSQVEGRWIYEVASGIDAVVSFTLQCGEDVIAIELPLDSLYSEGGDIGAADV